LILWSFLGILKKGENKTGSKDKLEKDVGAYRGMAGPNANEESSGRGPDMGKERIKIDFLIHDLKVPLAVIEAGITSLLNRQDKYGKLTEKQEKVLRRVLRNTKVTQRLVNDALELGRSREGVLQVSTCCVSDIVKNTLLEVFDLTNDRLSEEVRTCSDLAGLKETLAPHGMALAVEQDLWAREVCLDEAKVRQILRNLLNNALKYRRSSVEVAIGKEDDSLVISVSDDGEGIPQEYHKRIFECYFQMNGEGSCPVRGHGLGLAGVMVLVEDMGGKLTLESDQGCGAKFSVKIPLRQKC